jgi:transcriptional regulator with XRE-family HTH domain
VRHVTPPTRRGPRGKTIHKSVLSGYLKRARAAAGLIQNEVATRAGLSREVYNAYEAGRRGMEVTKVPALAAALGVPAAEMMALADEPGVVAELAVQMAELRRRVERLESNG